MNLVLFLFVKTTMGVDIHVPIAQVEDKRECHYDCINQPQGYIQICLAKGSDGAKMVNFAVILNS